MSSDANNSDAAFQELIRMLEGAVLAGVSSIGMEFEDRNLIVYYHTGNMGLGAARIPKELERDVINELVRRTGLDRKTKGKMPVMLLGKEYDVVVEESQSFDEPVFNLTIKERKKKAAK